jgi:signal transduction histidine kinase
MDFENNCNLNMTKNSNYELLTSLGIPVLLEHSKDCFVIINDILNVVFVSNCKSGINTYLIKNWENILQSDTLNESTFSDEIKYYFETDSYLTTNCYIHLGEESKPLLYRFIKYEITNKSFLLIQFIDTNITELTPSINKIKYEDEKLKSGIKTDLFNILSHELRTPLSVMMLNAEYLSNSLLQKQNDQKKSIKKIVEKIDYITSVINKYLNLHILQIDTTSLVLSKVSIVSFIKSILDNDYSPWFDNRTVEFEIIGKDEEISIDKEIMNIIINNILTNAFKYSTDSGENPILKIVVRNNYFKIIISDSGIGIIDSDKNKIFTKFYRGKNARNVSGSGLGFSIVKKLVKIHRGSISFKSSTLGTTVEILFKKTD